MSNFITPNELLACLDEVIILDARGYQDYKKGHIKGSYAVDLNKDLTGPLGEHGGRQIWSVWLLHLSLMVSLVIPRLLCMTLGFSWRDAFGGCCVTWA